MNDPVSPPNEPTHSDPVEGLSQTALFAQLVIQQSNMALMLLGQVPHPESGKSIKDVDAAKVFIDQLEMLEAKTKGNLTKQEEGLLKQSLMTLRLSFVEAVKSSPPASGGPAGTGAGSTEPTRPVETPLGKPAPEEEEHRKKFSKKY